MKTFKAPILLVTLLAIVFQLSPQVEANPLLCHNLFEQNASLQKVLTLPYGHQLITRPEISKSYESELTQILSTEKLENMNPLRVGQGNTYTAKIRKYGLDVIVKHYPSFYEVNDSFAKDPRVRAEEEKAYEKENSQKLKNEIVAWKVSRATGMDVFPLGVIREIRGQSYWVQLFVDVKKDSHAITYRKNSSINEISESPSGVRDYLLSYLLGDLDHGGNSLYHLTERRQFYIDAGAAFNIVLTPSVRKSKNLNEVHPFELYGNNLSKEQVMQDSTFFKNFLQLNPKNVLQEINELVPNDEARIDFELRFLKVQSQIKNLLY